MPYVNVKITRDGVTPEQKRQIVEDITNSLVNTLGKKPEHVHIVIDEIEQERRQPGHEDALVTKPAPSPNVITTPLVA